MNTVIDVGNTRVKVGFFEEGRLTETVAFAVQPWQNFYTCFSSRIINNCIVSSTVNLPEHIIQYLKKKAGNFIYLDENTPLPIINSYHTKATLGKDRIALAVGAAHIYPSQNILVVNTGTCVTYNLIEENGSFAGGAISPGLHMRLKAMHTFTAQLPQPQINESQEANIIGTSTNESLLSGAINGLVFEIAGFIKALNESYFPVQVILSGGDCRYVAERLQTRQQTTFITEPYLALNGLHQILQFNGKS